MPLTVVRHPIMSIVMIMSVGAGATAYALSSSNLHVVQAQLASPSITASPIVEHDAGSEGFPVDDLQITIDTIQDIPAEVEESLPPANQALGRHIVLKLNASNTSKHAVDLWPTGSIRSLVLIDAQGRVFSVDDAATTVLTTRLSLHTAPLQPGLTAEAVLVYDLPKDVASVRLSNDGTTVLGDYMIGNSSGAGFRVVSIATPSPQEGADVQSGCWDASDRANTTKVASDGTTTTLRQWKEAPRFIIDVSKGYTATIKTNKGTFIVQLNALDAPFTVNNFVCLAEADYYDNTPFHRIVAGFVIQGGDPFGTGRGGPGYQFIDEKVTKDYQKGTLAMANAGPNTNGSQFFICLRNVGLPKNFTIFGQVTDGQDIVDLIGQAVTKIGPSGENSEPIESILIESVTISNSPR